MAIVDKNKILIPNFNGIPEELKNLDQWVLWKAEKDPEKDEFTKVPYQANGADKAMTNDKTSWGTFKTISEANLAGKGDGVGFILTEEDPYACIDIDELDDVENLPLNIQQIVDMSYSELSPSGTGIHVWVKFSHDNKKLMNKNAEQDLEIYDKKRFMTVTGENINALTINGANHISTFVEETFRRKIKPQKISNPVEPGVLLTDEEVLERMFQGKKGEKIRKLYVDGDTSDYGNDHSSADLALCSSLCFFCNNQIEQVQRLFEQSALNRDKWIQRPDYRARTIDKALYRIPVMKNHDIGDEITQRICYGLTDVGNAKRLIDEYGHVIKYSHQQDAWLIWDGGRWGFDRKEQIFRFAQEIPSSIRRDAVHEDHMLKESMMKFATKSENIGRMKAMVNTARFQEAISVDINELDKDIYLFNVANGTLNLETGKLQPHNKKDLITKQSTIVFDPDAKCEVWNKFLYKVMGGDLELIKYLQRIVGYALTGDTSEHKFFFLYGDGRNGKSTFMEVISFIICEYANTTPMSTFMQKANEGNSNDIAALKGSRFVSAQETEKNRVFAESKIKQLTGGDMVKARFLYQEYFEFNPQFKIFIAGNHKPTVMETKEAIWNRLRLIPFEVRIEDHERDPHLKEKLIGEASGILNWMLEGCLEWKENGLQCPSSVISVTEEYREEMDVVKRFLNDCFIINPLAKESFKSIYAVYNMWAQYNGESGMSPKALGTKMKERFKGREIMGQRIYEGLALRKDVHQSLVNSNYSNNGSVSSKSYPKFSH